MGQSVSGPIDRYAAGIHDFIAAGGASATDLTSLTSVKRAPSSGYAICTATSVQLVWKDAGGNAHDSGALTQVVGNVVPLPPGMTELTTNTGLACFLFWNA